MLGGSLGKGPWFPFILVALSLSLDSEYLLALRRKKDQGWVSLVLFALHGYPTSVYRYIFSSLGILTRRVHCTDLTTDRPPILMVDGVHSVYDT